MKVSKIILLVIYLFLTILSLKSQNMSNLYEQLIIDNYNRYSKDNYTLKTDTMYYISSFSDCYNNFWDYDLNIRNESILFKMPNVNKFNPISSVFKLCSPELDGQFISISIGVYMLQYKESDEDIALIYKGTISYIYNYNKKKEKYELITRKDF